MTRALPSRYQLNQEFWLFLLVWIMLVDLVVAKSIEGEVARCTNEGEPVEVSVETRCYQCFCRRGVVECDRSQCPSLEGCHAILAGGEENSCCPVCKGCKLDGNNTMPSGVTWLGEENPCLVRTCQAGVVTVSKEVCAPPCKHPVYVPGQCCPSCPGCHFNGQEYMTGETFKLTQDPSVECLCKGHDVTCSRRACPVLNCPEDRQYFPHGDKCPKCKGRRTIYDTRNSCYFAKRVYSDGDLHLLDTCTACLCQAGTMICQREHCPELTCAAAHQVTTPGECCPSCRGRRGCKMGNITMKQGDTWLSDPCEICTCQDGKHRCKTRKCLTTSCPPGSSLSYKEDRCCPVCRADEGKCKLRGLYSSKITTFDQQKYTTEGICTHDLVRDCGQGQFQVTAKFANTTQGHIQIDIVSIRFGATRVKLSRNMAVRINRTRLQRTVIRSGEFSIRISPAKVEVKIKLGLTVIWNTQRMLSVKVNREFHRSKKLCGLCGNFDGNQLNDLVNRQQRPVRHPSQMASVWVRGRNCRKLAARLHKNVRQSHLPATIGHDNIWSNEDSDNVNAFDLKTPSWMNNRHSTYTGTLNSTEESSLTTSSVHESDIVAKDNRTDGDPEDDADTSIQYGHINSGTVDADKWIVNRLLETNSDRDTDSNTDNEYDILKKILKGDSLKNKAMTSEVDPGVLETAVSQGYCDDNSVEWIEARQDCRRARNVKLQTCEGLLEVTSFMRDCTETLCGCLGDQSCAEAVLTSYILPCNPTNGKATSSRKRRHIEFHRSRGMT